jgi:hypothetical protein
MLRLQDEAICFLRVHLLQRARRGSRGPERQRVSKRVRERERERKREKERERERERERASEKERS